eukprot:15223-Pelagococcus_subviridis.AAC.1
MLLARHATWLRATARPCWSASTTSSSRCVGACVRPRSHASSIARFATTPRHHRASPSRRRTVVGDAAAVGARTAGFHHSRLAPRAAAAGCAPPPRPLGVSRRALARPSSRRRVGADVAASTLEPVPTNERISHAPSSSSSSSPQELRPDRGRDRRRDRGGRGRGREGASAQSRGRDQRRRRRASWRRRAERRQGDARGVGSRGEPTGGETDAASAEEEAAAAAKEGRRRRTEERGGKERESRGEHVERGGGARDSHRKDRRVDRGGHDAVRVPFRPHAHRDAAPGDARVRGKRRRGRGRHGCGVREGQGAQGVRQTRVFVDRGRRRRDTGAFYTLVPIRPRSR